MALAAGLGWQGKSLLVVSPQFGPRLRLVTVLMDLPLAPDEPLRNRCGGCTACTDACPAKAIRGANTESHFGSREAAMRFDLCRAKVLEEFPKLPHITGGICGVCVSVCPWGRKGAKTADRSTPARWPPSCGGRASGHCAVALWKGRGRERAR